MEASGPSAWFLGELADPWVAALAAAMPAGSPRVDAEGLGGIPEAVPPGLAGVGTLVLHRGVLTPRDAERLGRLRADPRGGPRRVLLCLGPHARHRDLERWAALVDLVLPEATAAETLARHLLDPGASPRARLGPAGPKPPVAVISTDFELRQVLADSCRAAGYPAEPRADWPAPPPDGLAVWDVPVLEPDWPAALAHAAHRTPIVALLGFADRETVSRARHAGAAACLDLPYDPADLAYVLDRLAARLALPAVDPAHAVPPAPAAHRRARTVAEVAGRGAEA